MGNNLSTPVKDTVQLVVSENQQKDEIITGIDQNRKADETKRVLKFVSSPSTSRRFTAEYYPFANAYHSNYHNCFSIMASSGGNRS